MINMPKKEKVLAFIKKHKIIVALSSVIVVIISFFVYNNVSAEKIIVKYVLTNVEKGSISSSISGSG